MNLCDRFSSRPNYHADSQSRWFAVQLLPFLVQGIQPAISGRFLAQPNSGHRGHQTFQCTRLNFGPVKPSCSPNLATSWQELGVAWHLHNLRLCPKIKQFFAVESVHFDLVVCICFRIFTEEESLCGSAPGARMKDVNLIHSLDFLGDAGRIFLHRCTFNYWHAAMSKGCGLSRGLAVKSHWCTKKGFLICGACALVLVKSLKAFVVDKRRWLYVVVTELVGDETLCGCDHSIRPST